MRANQRNDRAKERGEKCEDKGEVAKFCNHGPLIRRRSPPRQSHSQRGADHIVAGAGGLPATGEGRSRKAMAAMDLQDPSATRPMRRSRLL